MDQAVSIGACALTVYLGGYLGDWAHEIDACFHSQIYTFEAIKLLADKISQRFAKDDSIHVYNFGLGSVNEHLELALAADGIGAYKTSSNMELVEIKEIQAFLSSEQIMVIDLIKINIEGGEFDLLKHIVDTGVIQQIKKIQVQFHDFAPDAIRRRESLTKKLALTHRRTWNYYFVWEEWEIV